MLPYQNGWLESRRCLWQAFRARSISRKKRVLHLCLLRSAPARWTLPLPVCGKQPFSLPRNCRDGCSTGWKEWGIHLNCSETRTLVMFCTFNTAIPVHRRSARPAGKLPCSLRGRCGRPADRRSLPLVRLLQAGTLRGPNRCWGWNSVAGQKIL